MALTNSNTYTEPTSGSSLNIARIQFNDSLRSILSNFKSAGTPTDSNFTAGGAVLGEVDGMLFRSEQTDAIYISDSLNVKSAPVGGNFTRVGIGNRVENGIVALGANATSYEIGELVATVSESPSLAANARLYLCTSNTSTTGSTSNFIDVGTPSGISASTNDNVIFTGSSITSSIVIASSNVAIGTTAPDRDLTTVGTARISGNTLIQQNTHILGSIGVGTSTPSYVIEASGATNPTIAVSSTGTAATDDSILLVNIGGTAANSIVNFSDSSGIAGSLVYAHSDDALSVKIGGSTISTIDSDGLSVTGRLSSSNTKPTVYYETYVSLGTSTTVDCSSGNIFRSTPSTSNPTYTFSNPPATSTAYAFTLLVTPSVGLASITWPAAVVWTNGTAPDIPDNSTTSVYVFFTYDSGSTWYGFISGAAMA